MAGLRYRIRCQAEKQGRRAATQVEDMSGWSGTLEYVVHHRLENFVCLVAQQQFEDVEIFPIGTCRVAGPPEAQGNPGSRFTGLFRAFVPQGSLEALQLLCRDFLLLEVRIPARPSTGALPGAGRDAVVIPETLLESGSPNPLTSHACRDPDRQERDMLVGYACEFAHDRNREI